jgi:hypothetical protein
MTRSEFAVTTAAELVAALGQDGPSHITVLRNVTGLPSLRLAAGQTLVGEDPGVRLGFAPGQDGFQLSTDNHVEGLELVADCDRRAIFNDTEVDTLGRLVLVDLRVTGAVRLLARDRVRSGHVRAFAVDIVAADARGFDDRPKGFGVEVVPGAFTLWNQQADPGVTITAELVGLSVGRAGAPVQGGGVFVGGTAPDGGRLIATRLETDAVYSDGGIAPGTADRISGGVFVVSGAFVDQVRNRGPVTTYGPNDMVLDNWGAVDLWVAEDSITSHGPSGIGFVNFGTIDTLEVSAPIETFGQGARGFNVYAGTIRSATFDRVVTHADGAVGIQISQPVGEIRVRRGIETFGGRGASLVKGVVVELPAIPLSIKPGGTVRWLEIAGGLTAHGQGIEALEVHGAVDTLQISGGLATLDGAADPP